MSLRPGDAVEHFVIVSLLGEGGMGQVYVARDTRLQRSIALKIMRVEATGGDDTGEGASNGAARLLREAQAAAALEHPNVVTIYEVGEIRGEGEEAGRPFIAMELVKGKPLRALMGNEGVPMKERIRWLADVARALGTAHRAGLVHRDIKPENVMVRDDGTVKVLDFGLAKRGVPGADSLSSSTEAQVLPSLTGKGIAIGTPYYMAPEQMRGEALDGRADQFAWGVVAYELLSGTPAWGRDIGALALVSKLLTEDPPSLTELRPDVPVHVATVVMRSLAKRPSARYDTMEALIGALEDEAGAFAPTMQRTAATEPPSAPRESEAGRTETTASTPVAPRGRKILALAGAAALATGALVAESRRPVPRRVTTDAVSAPSGSPAARAPGFPDFGSTMSKVPEAADAYRAGVSAFRDADVDRAVRELSRALRADPSFAAAHLRYSLTSIPPSDVEREHLREATRLRTSLGAHDQTLVDALAPLIVAPGDLVESGRRLQDASSRFPADADLVFQLCRVLSGLGENARAIAACTRATELDPGGAAPFRSRAIAEMSKEDVPAALASFEACLRVSPLATWCLSPLTQLRAFEGNCDAALATARRSVSADRASSDAYDTLAEILMGAGEPLESVRTALSDKLDRVPAAEARIDKLYDQAHLFIRLGDFAGANRQLRAWDDEVASSRDEDDHYPPAVTRVQLALEEGRNGDARSLASDYLAHRPAWATAGDVNRSIFFDGTLYRIGALPREEFIERRTKWLAWRTAQSILGSARAWIVAYAEPAKSVADAREALEVLPSYLPLPDPMARAPHLEEPIGRVYHLAGRDAEAIPFLRQASKVCFGLSETFEETWASLELGEALEAVGEHDAACDAYRVVTLRWGAARTSLSARRAEGRLRALACAR